MSSLKSTVLVLLVSRVWKMNTTFQVVFAFMQRKKEKKVTKLNTKLVSEKNYFANILTCSIQKLRVICIYFSPHCPINLKRKLIATEICMFRNDEEIIVGGDFNQEKDLDILIENGFRRGTIEHTTNLGTSIDHLYFKNILNIEFGRNRKYYSDHCNLFVIIQSEQSFKSKTLLRVNNSKFDNLMDQTRISNPTDISSLTNNSNRLLEPAIPRLSNTSGFYQAWVIDRLNTQSSIGLIHFMKYPDINYECNEQNLYCRACCSIGGMNSISLFCKLATVLYDFLCHLNLLLKKKKCRKCF